MSLTNRGHAVLILSFWERFKEICALHQVPVSYYFKARRKFFLNKLCSIVPNISVIPKKDTHEEDSLIISSSLSPLDVWNSLKVDDQEIKLKPYNISEMLPMHLLLFLRSCIYSLLLCMEVLMY